MTIILLMINILFFLSLLSSKKLCDFAALREPQDARVARSLKFNV
jgi:hypothetical protein